MAKVAVDREGVTQAPKACKRCGETKPPDDFYKHSRMADGLLSFCKPCTRSRVAAHRVEHLEAIREYDRNRPHRNASAEAQRQRRALFSAAHRAHVAVGNALASGDLTRMPCEMCGSTPADGHHDDYAKPLDVRWLCRPHHIQHHVLHGPGANAF
jgi:hypothetical protein